MQNQEFVLLCMLKKVHLLGNMHRVGEDGLIYINEEE
jgi:hypothetical protein